MVYAVPFCTNAKENEMIDKLNKWAELLLDTGKKNNLISFKDSKASTATLVYPDYKTIFDWCERMAPIEIFDIGVEDDEDELDFLIDNQHKKVNKDELSRDELVSLYASKLKSHQVLPFNPSGKPISAIKNIRKASKTALEETGVNIAYIAFGFIHWREELHSEEELVAPVLLLPITIENESHAEPYRIRAVDNEQVLNPTFAYKMKHEYGIVLPEYDDEEGPLAYFERIEGLVSRLGWRVTNECKIGIFSFLKINMYTDLKENASKIIENETVKALMGEAPLSTPVSSDDTELLNVVDADSSQLEAIKLAKEGKSFVLQGPPGTGKSQTITNMIAQCLSDGKKVLFVSEKLAALNVVYSKLKAIGLEDFCLELHSHKANKKQVINELCRTLKAKKSELSSRAEMELEAKKKAKGILDEYAKELHKKRDKINKSLYEMLEEISGSRLAPNIDYAINDIENKGEEHIDSALVCLKRYVEYTSIVGLDYRKNCWYGIKSGFSYRDMLDIKSKLNMAIDFIRELMAVNSKALSALLVSVDTVSEAETAKELFGVLKDSYHLSFAHLNRERVDTAILQLEKMIPVAINIERLEASILNDYNADALTLDGADIKEKLIVKYPSWLSRLFKSEYKNIINSIRLLRKDGRKISYNDALNFAIALDEYSKAVKQYDDFAAPIKSGFASDYTRSSVYLGELLSELRKIKTVRLEGFDVASLIAGAGDELSDSRHIFGELYDEYKELFETKSQGIDYMVSVFDAEIFDIRNTSAPDVLERCLACYNNSDKLENWAEFMRLLAKLDELDIRGYVNYAIDNRISTLRIVVAYKKAFYTQLVNHIVYSTDAIIELPRVLHDEAVDTFCQKDLLSLEINRAKIKAKLSQERPSLDMVAQGSAVSMLLREGEKKRKQKNIRQLLLDAQELVQTIKPLFLMSPLSVSTYLSADMSFDVVVFDEASQIFPQDAIGAIYRGSQLIVVGDSKQMPPSNFFTAMAGVDEDDDSLSDFESVLDVCSATFPQCSLKWHYRSRYEELISFSNKNFYGNSLVTFPSAQKERRGVGVDYYYVDGHFDRRTKTNLAEAIKVVDLVFASFEKYPERSVGVVAFSMSQQNLIDKLIARRRRENTAYEEFFKSTREEPFFVKNLETVQGDERDTIIFSVAYGKDTSGKVMMNFGPINRAGGERRLNVAVTRAKCNVQLVSTMHYYDIDLTRATSMGAKLLREYLDYAENGIIALSLDDTVAGADVYSSFEQEIYDFVGQSGYSAQRQVGCSEFKIDIGVKHPDRDDFVMAIECDGESYLSEKTTRDRDRLRKAVLENMGWQFFRVWSVDWFKNKESEKERLLYAIERAIEHSAPIPVETETESFATESTEEIFEFPEYETVNIDSLMETEGCDIMQTVLAVMGKEAPICEEWLLRRMISLFDAHSRVTTVAKESFDYTMRNCASLGIERRDGFMYLVGKEIPMLRVPKDDATVIRDIKYISTEELSYGLYEIIKRNVSVEKLSLYRLVVQKLGFSRITDTITDKLDEALEFLKDKITVEDGIVSVKS